jgi:hypothetical protein
LDIAVLHDSGLFDPILECLLDLSFGEVFVFDTRAAAVDTVRRWLARRTGHVSVHNFATDHGGDVAGEFKRWVNANPQRGDYTVYEYPRVDLRDWQVLETLRRHFLSSPLSQAEECDRFFQLLSRRVPYEVVATSRDGARLEVGGTSGWMVLAGPIEPGDQRFAPGCELFYNGASISGTFGGAGMNILPLGMDFDRDAYDRSLDLSRTLADDPLTFQVEAGRVTSFNSPTGRSAKLWRAVFETDSSFADVVEVGIGLSDEAGPIITDWAAPSNEAIRGVHVGFGANPGNFDRTGNLLHIDFVAAGATVNVNDEPFLR